MKEIKNITPKEQVIEKCRGNLIFFGKVISPQTYYLKTPDFHYEVAELLSDRAKKQVMVEAPRGYGKSSICSFFVLHHCLFDSGDKLIVIQSKTQREAKRRLGKIKNIIEFSHVFKDLFGFWGEQIATTWRDDEISVKTSYGQWTISAKGTGQQVRGMNEDDTRITLYYLDDPDDEDNCKTKEAMEDNFSKFLGGVSGLDKRTGRCCIVGTPITEGCIVARVRNAVGWATKRFSACDEDTKEVLWEEMMSWKELMDKKAELDSQGMLWKFYAEYQCELTGRDDQIFKAENFTYYSGTLELQQDKEHYLHLTRKGDEKYSEPKIIPVYTFIGVDPAISENPRADFTVIMAIALDRERNIYILPYTRKRMLFSDTLDAIISMNNKYLPLKVTIEANQAQDSFRDALKNLDNIYIPGLAQKDTARDKKAKRYLDVLEDYHRRRKIFLLEGECRDLYEEMLMFPRGAKHDDTIDALYWAVKKAYAPDHEVRSNSDLLNRDFWGKRTEPTWMTN